jgi:hypothetical protein
MKTLLSVEDRVFCSIGGKKWDTDYLLDYPHD